MPTVMNGVSWRVGHAPRGDGADGPLSRHAFAVGRSAAGPDALVFVVLAVVCVARLALLPLSFEADSWLALVDGRAVAHAGLLHFAPFTIMLHGDTFVDQQWLAQLAIYELVRVGGIAALGVGFVVLHVTSLAAAAFSARRLGAEAKTVLLMLAATSFLTWMPTQVRPEEFVLPLFVTVVYLLATDSRHDTSRVYLCLPLLILWANLHGSAVLGAGLIVLRGVTFAWERRRELAIPRNLVRAIVLTVGAPACLLATPYGLNTLIYYRDTLLNPALRQWISEWQPITAAPILAVPFCILAAITLWSFKRNPRSTTLWERVTLLVLAISTVTAQRNAVWFGLAALMLVPISIDPSVRKTKMPPARPRINRSLSVAALSIVIILSVSTATHIGDAVKQRAPGGALRAVDAAIASDPSLKVFADANIADWLLWHQPALGNRLAYNDQLELLSGNQFALVARLNFVVGPDWARAASGYRLLVLSKVYPDSIRAFAHEPGARVLYRGNGYSVILRGRQAAWHAAKQ